MKKYRKKPIVIEALLWTGKNHRDMWDFLEDKTNGAMDSQGDNFYIDHSVVVGGLIIKTSEGNMEANPGDYIIKEPFDKERGFYPCKPDIFKQTYEEIE